MARAKLPPTVTVRLPVDVVKRLDSLARAIETDRAGALRGLLGLPGPDAPAVSRAPGKRVSEAAVARQERLNAGKG